MMVVIRSIFRLALVIFLGFTVVADELPQPGVSSKSQAGQQSPTPILAPVMGIKEYGYKIVKRYPHDPQAFTQGLVYHQGFLYESTGQYGHSSVRKVDLETGSILKSRELSPFFFGGGLAIYDRKLVPWTFRARL